MCDQQHKYLGYRKLHTFRRESIHLKTKANQARITNFISFIKVKKLHKKKESIFIDLFVLFQLKLRADIRDDVHLDVGVERGRHYHDGAHRGCHTGGVGGGTYPTM